MARPQWTITLHERADQLPQGRRAIKALTPTAGTLQIETDQIALDLVLAAGDLADARWAAWQTVRKTRALLQTGPCRLRANEGVSDQALLTLGLDLHHAWAGQLELEARPEVVARFGRLAGAEDLYRAWVNEDATTRTSLAIAEDVRAWAEEQPSVQIEVLDTDALREAGLNLMLAVGGASSISPPRLVVASYTAPGDLGRPLMLLGKGITFDSGGINVKPYDSYVSMMKNDMAGAALAWALFRDLVEAGHPRSLVLVLPTCENPIGENAVRPGTVVRSHRGLRVRIDHTDAEGRLVLADGLSWASHKHAPSQVLCFATLTTAALVSYGPYATPVHFAEPPLERRLREASTAMGEDLHFFPARIWHREANRDHEADLRNTARLPGHASRAAGSRNAAHFLRYFTDAPLVHFDIFASTWNWAGDAPGCGFGATGAPLRTLITALEESA